METIIGNGLEWTRKLFNTIKVGIIIIDPDTRTMVDVNNQALIMLGHRREDVIGELCSFCFSEQNPQNCPVLDRGLDLDDYETYITRSDGTRLTILKTVNTVIFDNKRYLIESFTDITKIKEAECKAETYLKLAPALFVALDENANIIMVNDFGKELLECDDSIIGKNWFENFIPDYDKDRIWDVFEELADGRVKYSSAENEVVTAKGNKRVLLWKNTVLKNIDGQKIIILSAGDDITEQRLAEKELEKYWAEEEARLERNLEQLSLLGTNKMEA